ncbi:MAG: hypothetical protein ACREFO_02920 [Acetobacteraceae bacterium]
MSSNNQEEVDRNYEAFLKILPSILRANRNKYALMKDEKILGYYGTAADARVAADTFIADGRFSIQEVTDSSVDLGFYTDAVPVD